MKFGSIRGIAVGRTGPEREQMRAGAGRFGGRKGVSTIVAQVLCLLQLLLPRRLLGFRVGFP